MVPSEVPVLVSAGCDYLTVFKHRSADSKYFEQTVINMLDCEAKAGGIARPWRMAGFEGFVCGQVEFGVREDGHCARLRSETAQIKWRDLYALADNCSRIDTQCTARFSGSVGQRIVRYLAEAKRNRLRGKARGEIRWDFNTSGGKTIYCGKRRSNVFGRIYDKFEHKREEQWSNCVRFEIQCQKRMAQAVARELYETGTTLLSDARHVPAFFEGYIEMPRFNMETLKLSVLPRSRTDASERLGWMEKCVGPTARALVRRGMAQELLDALGLAIDENELKLRSDLVQERFLM